MARIAEPPWPDVAPLPELQEGNADVYLRFPSKTTLDRSRHGLRRAGFAVWAMPGELVLRVGNTDPLWALRLITGMLSPPECRETLALLRPVGVAIEAADKFLAMGIAQLRDRLSASWLIDVLRTQTLECVFQPIVRADDPTSVEGFEALARARRNDHEVEPAEMIEVAKSAHIMSQFDALAMRTALTEGARLKIDSLIFVNCAPAHIFDPATRIDEVGRYCDELSLKRDRVVLEITETEENDRAHLRNFMQCCRLRGFRVVLDDVGAGYATIDTMAEFRPNLIKIDGRLVRSIETDPYRAVIFNRLLDATKVLGISTIVEGVETEAEFQWARANGATYVQGFLFGKPAAIAG